MIQCKCIRYGPHLMSIQYTHLFYGTRFMRSTLNKRSSSRSPRRSSVSAALIRDGRNYSNGYLNALWQWRKVKTATDSVVQSLEKQFLIDDTAINTSLLTTRLDNLEKLLRKAGII